jgi:phosphoribosyl 1,2-cyclic phosphodiesterase
VRSPWSSGNSRRCSPGSRAISTSGASAPLHIASLGSGSRGNGTVVASAGTRLLIDCGFSLRETSRRLERLGLRPAELDGILVTHEHSDHASGVAALSRAGGLPVFATHGTFASGRLDGCAREYRFNAGDAFDVGDIAVSAVAVPHDAREPCQYRLAAGGVALGVLTDLGSVTAHVVEAFSGCQGLILEFNHDRAMLAAGAYPPALKRRVGGDWGHLNNDQASALLSALDGPLLRELVIAHMSERNNSEACVRRALEAVHPGWLQRARWARQGEGFPWLALERR